MKVRFGWFREIDGYPAEDFESYKKIKNTIPKNDIIKHIENLPLAISSEVTNEIFTGEELPVGIYIDGNFWIASEFLHYYKNYDIGIPYEYEEYLKKIIK